VLNHSGVAEVESENGKKTAGSVTNAAGESTKCSLMSACFFDLSTARRATSAARRCSRESWVEGRIEVSPACNGVEIYAGVGDFSLRAQVDPF
jgi:hypothetical protein